MGLQGCAKCLQATLIAANLLILVVGIACLGVGIWSHADKNSLDTKKREDKLAGSQLYSLAAYILIGTATFIVITAVLGCVGAFKESKCLLVIYFIILTALFILLMVGGGLGFAFIANVHEKMRKTMLDSMLDYGDSENEVTVIWDKIQQDLQCCGTNISGKSNSYESWANQAEQTPAGKKKRFFPNAFPMYPKSCCRETLGLHPGGTEDKCQEPVNVKLVYNYDCYDKVYNLITEHGKILGGFGIICGLVLVLGMIFSICLCISIQ